LFSPRIRLKAKTSVDVTNFRNHEEATILEARFKSDEKETIKNKTTPTIINKLSSRFNDQTQTDKTLSEALSKFDLINENPPFSPLCRTLPRPLFIHTTK
jgi:hypothetical protein